ncbi:M28 family peptidase [Oscillospiraceae bacterium PP1C4]
MKHLKKTLSIVIAVMMVLPTLSGCATSKEVPSAAQSSSIPSSSQAESIPSAPAEGHAFSGKQALAYADQYTSFGLHRTGTETEIASTKWVAEELERIGFDTELQELKFKRFDLKDCKVTVDEKEIKSFPFWFPASTGDKPIQAPLVIYDEKNPDSMTGKIVYYDMPGMQTNADISPIAAKAKEAGALAVIATVIHPNGLPSGQNTLESNTEKELPLPAAIISMTEKGYMAEAAKKNATASVLINGNVVSDAKAYNVIGKIDNQSDQWVVVTTPLSGWFTCNAERAGGVGLFIELAQTVKDWDKSVNYLFIGNTGHELNFMGAHASETFAPSPEKVKLWLHCGSAIAAKEPIAENFKFLGFSEDIAKQVTAAFSDVSSVTVQNNKEKLMQSELGSFISKGYTAFGLYGANKDFHTQADTSDGISESELTKLGESIVSLFKEVLKS